MHEHELNIENGDQQLSLQERYDADLADLNERYREERKRNAERVLRDVDDQLNDIEDASPASAPYVAAMRAKLVDALREIG
ncbi:hypothetical protein [Barrientosiimonas humi]|uniref:hypothetical protein n=1 Tax=Barrientosiimonas humi TaxID=999931 RepID=UPI0014771B13|nr:hypothetical protein [Barrientosiimonas humi]